MAETGESSRSRHQPVEQQSHEREVISYEKSVVQLSNEGRRTHLVVEQNRSRPLNTNPGAYSTFFDNTCPQFNWLRDGWLVEERRIMLTGRLYRYYYDPVGKMYYTKHEVKEVFACIDRDENRKDPEVIIIDD